MKVYRVQNSIGKGPYCIPPIEWGTKNHSTSRRTPPPREEFNLQTFSDFRQKYENNDRKLLFGFSSKEKLRKWFSKRELAVLKRHGFDVYEIEVDPKNIVLGNEKSKQLVYISHRNNNCGKIVET